jgi:O-antigen ligase
MKFNVSVWPTLCDRLSIVMILLSALFLPFSTAGLEISTYLALLVFLMGGRYTEKFHFLKKQPFALAGIGLFLIVLLWSFHSLGTPHDMLTRIKAYEKILLIPVTLWAFARFPKMRDRFLLMLIISLLLNFILGILKFHHCLPAEWSTAFQSDSSASFGSFKGSGHIALSYIASMLTFGFSVVFIHQYRFLSTTQKIVTSLCTLFCFYYLLAINDGRSGFLILGVLAVYLLIRMIFSFKAYKFALLCLIGGIFVISLAYQASTHLKQSIDRGKTDIVLYQEGNHLTSWGYRIYMWENTLKLIRKKPLIGYGTGSIANDWADILHSPDTVRNPHNQYLFLWVENGILGLFAFLAFLFFAARNAIPLGAWQNPSTLPSSNLSTQTLKILLEGFVLAFATGCLYNSWLHDVHEGFFFILGLAALRSLIDSRTPKP